MMSLARTTAGAMMTLTATLAQGQSTTTLGGEDFVLDYKKYVGQRVTITDCLINGAKLEFAGCFVGTPVMINVGYGGADREIRRRAMSECNAAEVVKRCFARVTGRVRKNLTGSVIGLDDATLVWAMP